MGRYLGKRLISTIPLLLVISFVVFMFIHMIPGDPARLVAGQDATKEDVAVLILTDFTLDFHILLDLLCE